MVTQPRFHEDPVPSDESSQAAARMPHCPGDADGPTRPAERSRTRVPLPCLRRRKLHVGAGFAPEWRYDRQRVSPVHPAFGNIALPHRLVEQAGRRR